MNKIKPEVWLRGPLPMIPDLLQPAAHALLQTREDINECTIGFPETLIWEEPAGRASVGFHLNHITGVLDRLLTYAEGDELSEEQIQFLKNESVSDTKKTIPGMIHEFEMKVEEALMAFARSPESYLTKKRNVGRKKLPSTVIGLYFHAAEHSQRHAGQLLVTISVLKEKHGIS